jgi:hypothetical protein
MREFGGVGKKNFGWFPKWVALRDTPPTSRRCVVRMPCGESQRSGWRRGPSTAVGLCDSRKDQSSLRMTGGWGGLSSAAKACDYFAALVAWLKPCPFTNLRCARRWYCGAGKIKIPLLAKEARNGAPGRPSPRRQQTVRSNPALAARHPVPLRRGMVPLCSCKVILRNTRSLEAHRETGQS